MVDEKYRHWSSLRNKKTRNAQHQSQEKRIQIIENVLSERESKRTVLKIWQITGNPQTTYSITLDDFLEDTTTFNCNILD